MQTLPNEHLGLRRLQDTFDEPSRLFGFTVSLPSRWPVDAEDASEAPAQFGTGR